MSAKDPKDRKLIDVCYSICSSLREPSRPAVCIFMLMAWLKTASVTTHLWRDYPRIRKAVHDAFNACFDWLTVPRTQEELGALSLLGCTRTGRLARQAAVEHEAAHSDWEKDGATMGCPFF